MIIKNRERVIADLAVIMHALDVDLHPYQTDVYLHVDDDGNGSLYCFSNVGGCSWLNNDDFVIYQDLKHIESYFDQLLIDYETPQEMADDIGIDYHQPFSDFNEIRDLCTKNAEVRTKVFDLYLERLPDVQTYREIASAVLSAVFEELEMRG